MKRKLVVSILSAALAAAMLWGCGKESAEEPVNESVAAESDEEDVKESEPESTAEPERELEAEQEPEASSAGESDWLEEQGLYITPQGDFTCSYSVYKTDELMAVTDEMGIESEKANMTVTETTENGYRKIEAVLLCDFAGVEKYTGDGYVPVPECIMFCFDRYTGAVMPWCSDSALLENSENSFKEHGFYEGQSACFLISEGLLWDGTLKGYKMTVFCPEDYDEQPSPQRLFTCFEWLIALFFFHELYNRQSIYFPFHKQQRQNFYAAKIKESPENAVP